MSEAVVFTGRAVVYYLDAANKSWASSGVAGYSRLDIYKNSATGTHRVIGRGLEDTSKVIINSMVTKDSNYNRVKETFHQFQDPQRTYGLNFAKKEDADAFAGHFEAAASGGGAMPPPAAKAAPQVAAKPAPPTAKPKPPGTPTTRPVSQNLSQPAPPPGAPGPPKAPPGPPPPPKKPAGVPAGGTSGNSALLNSITGFKGGLKKTETNDRSGPSVGPSKPAPAPPRSAPPIHNPSASSGDDWETESEPAPPKVAATKAPMGGGMDMMSEMLKRQQSLKSSSSEKAPVERAASQQTFKAPPTKPSAAVERSASSQALHTPVKNGSLHREKPAPPPVAPRNEAPPVPAPRGEKALTPRGGSGTSGLSPELQMLKDEIMAEVRLELEHMKDQIIAAIRDRN